MSHADYDETDTTPLDLTGHVVDFDQLNETSDKGILAVLPDDRLVLLTDFTRVRVGTGHDSAGVNHSGFWEYEVQGIFPGFYAAMLQLPQAIETARENRISNHQPVIRWNKHVQSIGAQIFDDAELRDEVIHEGWSQVITSLD